MKAKKEPLSKERPATAEEILDRRERLRRGSPRMMDHAARPAVVGCLLGGAIGDAMGSAYEGQRSPVRIDEAFAWEITDDTQLTLATCEAFEGQGPVDPQRVADRFASWHRERRITGYGATTLKALGDLLAGANWAMSGRRGEHAAGNGAAMRIAPVGLAMRPDDELWRTTIRDLSSITHKNDEAYAGALAIATVVSWASRGAWRPGDPLLSVVEEVLYDCAVRDRLRELADVGLADSIPAIAERFGNSGYVAESVPVALLVVERVATMGFEASIRAAIEAGGDTDTVASMVGQIVGASVGESGIPSELRDCVPLPESYLRIIEDFASRFRVG